jgi:hypothetical protein
MSTGPLIACTISWTGNTWVAHYTSQSSYSSKVRR